MKLHKDGTLEGTPQEIAEYNRLMAVQQIPAQKRWSPTDVTTPWMPTNPFWQPQVTCDGTQDIVQMQKEYWDKTSIWNRPSSRLVSGTVINAKVVCEGYKQHELKFDGEE